MGAAVDALTFEARGGQRLELAVRRQWSGQAHRLATHQAPHHRMPAEFQRQEVADQGPGAHRAWGPVAADLNGGSARQRALAQEGTEPFTVRAAFGQRTEQALEETQGEARVLVGQGLETVVAQPRHQERLGGDQRCRAWARGDQS